MDISLENKETLDARIVAQILAEHHLLVMIYQGEDPSDLKIVSLATYAPMRHIIRNRTNGYLEDA